MEAVLIVKSCQEMLDRLNPELFSRVLPKLAPKHLGPRVRRQHCRFHMPLVVSRTGDLGHGSTARHEEKSPASSCLIETIIQKSCDNDSSHHCELLRQSRILEMARWKRSRTISQQHHDRCLQDSTEMRQLMSPKTANQVDLINRALSTPPR